ncbi:MAG: hypothetical protein R3F40_03530 [Candidatus Competibacteraceae bacterium]
MLMRYTVAGVMADNSSGAPGFAIASDRWPTNPFFFPTPHPAPDSDSAKYEVRQAVNLCRSATSANIA